ncbi:GntR family transcriptional regulator [Terasakiella pusilla]|jgi:DNA-binding GntR family transcriptional regulator|uniref:GntR family transcriptional regulator n=1 Tax=Terasakiella pusilla TaxID=64973 RepID=UPI00048BBC48|nr:GntR family transcriptional regulator [Terasakiella pusilla]
MTSEKHSRGELAYHQLFEAIQKGSLKPGTRIRETDIAEEFGISRTPVRDAIRRLESDGLIVHLPHQGAVIKTLDHREIMEMYEMRQVLEGTAAFHAAQHASLLEIDELIELNDLMLKNKEEESEAADANRLFHQTLYRAANNRYLIDAINNLSNAMALLEGTTLYSAERVNIAFKEHQEIIEHIQLQKGKEADQSVRNHISNSQRVRIRMFR